MPEIESIALDEIARANLLPQTHAPDLAIDLERFLESHLRVRLDQHADLPADVLGVTHFCQGEPPRIEINRDLTGLPSTKKTLCPAISVAGAPRSPTKPHTFSSIASSTSSTI